jgi:hypothetical protein
MSWRDAWETTAYVVILDPDEGRRNRMRVRIRAERGIVVRFSVQYETEIEGHTYPVVRYDTAHDYAHRDRLDRVGRNVEKLYLGNASRYAEILDEAIAKIKTDWRRLLTEFVEVWQ